MSETSLSLKQTYESESPSISPFGYELIREILIPELLGPDTKDILYWAGKRLARRFPLDQTDDIIDFFHRAGWGHLSVKDESRTELEFELQSSLISERLKGKSDCTFQLEAGFLAQQIEFQKQVVAEAFEHPRKRSAIVRFTVKWDKKDPANF